MSYATLINTCTAHTFAAQRVNNKPHYTPRQALRKAVKLLRRVFRPSTTGKVVITAAEMSTEVKYKKNELTTTQHDVSTLTTCSTLSAEEYENQLNELTELEITINSFDKA